MNLVEIVRQSIDSLLRNRLRSALTMLGIVWGLVTVVLLISYGRSLGEGVLNGFLGIGNNVIMLWPGQTSMQAGGERAGRAVHFLDGDVEAVEDAVPFLTAVSPENDDTFSFKYGSKVINISSKEVGYNYAVGHKDTAAVLGGYGSFEFSHIGQAFTTAFTELFWGHQFSSRTTVSGGAGPVVIDVKETGGGDQVTWTAVARLQYERPRTGVSLRYLHYINGGSGFLLGAHSDVGVAEVSHQLTRSWNGLLHAGYAHSTQIEGVTVPGFAVGSNNSFDRGYAGVRFSRPLTEHTEFFVLYNYSQTDLDHNPFCGGGECGKVVRQNIGGVGFTWAPRPIRIR